MSKENSIDKSAVPFMVFENFTYYSSINVCLAIDDLSKIIEYLVGGFKIRTNLEIGTNFGAENF